MGLLKRKPKEKKRAIVEPEYEEDDSSLVDPEEEIEEEDEEQIEEEEEEKEPETKPKLKAKKKVLTKELTESEEKESFVNVALKELNSRLQLIEARLFRAGL